MKMRFGQLTWIWACLISTLSVMGCLAARPASPAKSAQADTAPKVEPGSKLEAGKPIGTEYLAVGDRIRVTYTDIPTPVPPTEQQIPETRKITLHLNLEVEFVGKTKTELEREIRDLYISKGFYKNIKIDIDVPIRTFYVGGEVHNQSVFPHHAKLTLTKAISMAGGFTEFAKKSSVHILRADGTKLDVNWKKAIKDPKFDQPIHPGDRIQVDRTIIF